MFACSSKEELNILVKQFIINSDCQEANNNLVSFLSLIQNNLCFIEDDHQLSKFGLNFVRSNLFAKNLNFCTSKLLSIISIKELDFKLKKFISIIIYLNLKLKSITVDVLRDFNFFKILINFIEENLDSYSLLKLSTDILFEYVKDIDTLTIEEFDFITDSFLTSAIKSINFYFTDNDDEKLSTYCKLKILLILNEQYLIKYYLNNGFENKIFLTLISHNDDNFTELLVFYFNRENDNVIKILILKFLYLIFTTSFTTEFFYLNDLKILTDIFIRELNDLSTESQENLINTYLKVFYPMLCYSQLKKEHYKKIEIKNLLNCLSKQPNPETIIKSSKRCLQINWLRIDDDEHLSAASHGPYSNSNISLSTISSDSLTLKMTTASMVDSISNLSISSISSDNSSTNSVSNMSTLNKSYYNKKLPPPPPPPPRRPRSSRDLRSHFNSV